MQIQIIGLSAGIGVPKTGFGVNLATYAYISLRPTQGPHMKTLALDDALSVGGKSGTFIWSDFKTSWTNIDPRKYPWVCNAHNLVGKTIELEVLGTMVGAGKVDIKMTLIDEDGETKSLVSKMNIDASGRQLTGLKVRGILKHFKGTQNMKCSP